MEYLIEVMPQLLVGALTTLKLFLYLDWLAAIRDYFSTRIVLAF